VARARRSCRAIRASLLKRSRWRSRRARRPPPPPVCRSSAFFALSLLCGIVVGGCCRRFLLCAGRACVARKRVPNCMCKNDSTDDRWLGAGDGVDALCELCAAKPQHVRTAVDNTLVNVCAGTIARFWRYCKLIHQNKTCALALLHTHSLTQNAALVCRFSIN
jgi:hypothetical protein